MAETASGDARSSWRNGLLPRLVDRALATRDRLLSDPGFQRFAARFPLTRPIARRHERAAFDLCAGFVYSQALLSAVRLGVLDRVRNGPRHESDLLESLPLPAARASLLIDALVALDLLSRRSGHRIGLGMLGGAIAANPSIAAMVEHNALLYEDLKDPVALLSGQTSDTRIARFWPYSGPDEARTVDSASATAYSDLMARSQEMIAAEILEAYPFGRHRSVLDVGGGEGAFLIAAARCVPSLSLQLFDLPPVATRAAERIGAAGLAHRIGISAGNFQADALPGGHDAITLVRVVHDHDDDVVCALAERIRAALAPGGVLIIAEPMSGVTAATRVADVYFAFYLMAMGRGRPRSAEGIEALLRPAGFSRFERIPTARPMLVSLLVAQ